MKPLVATAIILTFFVMFPRNVEAQRVEIGKSLTEKGINEAKTDSQKVNLIVEYGQEALNRGEIDTARVYFNRVKHLADSLNFNYARQLSFYGFGDFYLVQQKFDSAEVVLEKAAALKPGAPLETRIKNMLATTYRYQGDSQRAVELYKEALSLVDTTGEARTAAGIAQNLGDAYMNMGAAAEAFQNYNKAISFGERSKDSLFLATALNNVGNSYNAEEMYEEAAYYLKRALTLSQDLGFKPGELRTLLNLGNTRSSQSRFAEAESLYAKALELSKQVRPDSPPIQIQYNLGELYNRMNKPEEAEIYFKMSLDNSKEVGIPQGIYYNSVGLGNLEAAKGNITGAITRFETALEIARKLNSSPFLQETHEKLYELRKEKNEYEIALNHLEAFKSIADSLRTREKERMLADYQTRLEVQRKDQINKTLEAEKESQQAQLQLQYWLLGFGALFMLVVGIFAALLYRSNLQKKEINRKLKNQKQDLEEANAVKNKIFSIVAHDLRTPLSALTGILDLLRDGELSEEEMRELFSEMEFSLQQNMNIMENLLAWAKQQMRGLNIEIEPLSASRIVDEILEAHEFIARQKQIRIKNSISTDIKILGDYNLFKLVVRNLVSNSIKFSNAGDKITIDAETNDDEVLFKITDTGIGMPKEIQSKIFADEIKSRRGTRQEKGSGLGLNLCKEFIEKQGGSISFESTENKGTTFYFILPNSAELNVEDSQSHDITTGNVNLDNIHS